MQGILAQNIEDEKTEKWQEFLYKVVRSAISSAHQTITVPSFSSYDLQCSEITNLYLSYSIDYVNTRHLVVLYELAVDENRRWQNSRL